MRRLWQCTLILLLAGLMSTLFAEERVSAPSYSDTDSESTGTEITARQPGQAAFDYRASDALLQLRADWNQRYRALRAELALAADNAARDAVDEQLLTLKKDAQRAELELLLAEATAAGNDAYAAKLREVLEFGLEPANTPYEPADVQRDPVTGRALSGEEGGAE